MLYNLARNPDAQQKLLQEIDEIMPDGQVTIEALDRMPYMKSCVKESFRYHALCFFVNTFIRSC